MKTTKQQPTGRLAFEAFGQRLPLMILQSAAGFYLGTADESGPLSRESLEYWPHLAEARVALSTGKWTQRSEP